MSHNADASNLNSIQWVIHSTDTIPWKLEGRLLDKKLSVEKGEGNERGESRYT